MQFQLPNPVSLTNPGKLPYLFSLLVNLHQADYRQATAPGACVQTPEEFVRSKCGVDVAKLRQMANPIMWATYEEGGISPFGGFRSNPGEVVQEAMKRLLSKSS